MLRKTDALTALALSLVASTAMAQQATPSFVVPGTVTHTDYDGTTDDLLTAGLGAAGIGAAPAPAYADPANPTSAELRRNDIYGAWRGLYDMAAGGGYGVLYGPSLDANLNDTGTQGLVAGREYLALADDGSGNSFQTVMVQIPANFSAAQPCMVTAPSSGSRNVYGAVGTTAPWAFNHGCAVVYTDKGTGTFFHDLTADTVYDIRGHRGPRSVIGLQTNFATPMTADEAAYAAANPYRLAYKQAHSTKNVEANWGLYVLQSIQFGYWALNDYLGNGGTRFTPANTIVIAAGVSNGGGAALKAAEQDTTHLISGVVGLEPNIQPQPNHAFTINYAGTVLADHSKSLVDAYTLQALYAPCAALAPSLSGAALDALEPSGVPTGVKARANRCASLKDKGLLTSANLTDQASESLQIIHSYGLLAEQDTLIPALEYLQGYRQIIDTYVAEAGRFRVQDDICGVSFAATGANRRPAPLPANTAAAMFAAGNVIPPAAGVNTINDRAVEGPILEQAGTSASTGRQDMNIDGALCLRTLVTGQPSPGTRFGLRDRINSERVQQGVAAIRATGDLHGLPTLIIQGRSDEVLPPNFSGRAYFGANKVVEGADSNTRYVEVTHGQHFDTAINALSPGGVPAFIPLDHYFAQGLDRMWAYLTARQPLPASQVVRTTPRGTTAFTAANYKTFLPDIVATPAAGDAITFSANAVNIPQ